LSGSSSFARLLPPPHPQHALRFVLFHFVAEDAIYLDDTCSNNSVRANFVSEFLFATSEPGFVCPKKNKILEIEGVDYFIIY
jgi:hypothetical protein